MGLPRKMLLLCTTGIKDSRQDGQQQVDDDGIGSRRMDLWWFDRLLDALDSPAWNVFRVQGKPAWGMQGSRRVPLGLLTTRRAFQNESGQSLTID